MAELEPQPVAASPNKLVMARDFLVDTRAEMDKVSWPPKDELMQATKSVVLASLALGVVIGVADWILQQVLIGGVAMLTR